ncbi:MAG: hypothetical protein Q9203_001154 [Teloschistes exilis]
MPRPGTVKNFICGICLKGFSRRLTVKDPHFPSCTRRNGNPYNLAWDSHPSCRVQPKGRPSRAAKAGRLQELQELEELPEGIETTIQPPVPGATQKDRQQAVIWLALDVFSAHIAKADGEFAMQCKIVRTWREICNLLDDTEGMNKIHELMVGELGEVMADVALEMNSYGAQQ